jgi:drug/metabolite transporter (DMT)-like permease
MKVTPRVTGYLACLMAAILWGIHSVIIRYLTEQGVSPYLIAGSRLYIGTITIFIILNFLKIFKGQRKITQAKLHFESKFFWLAALSLGINFLFFQVGLKYTLASDANLIENFSPVVVLVIGTIILKHRIQEIAPTQKYWTSVFQIVIVGSIGASLILINDPKDMFVANDLKMLGDGIEFIAMLFFSIFIICSSEYAKTENSMSSLKTTMMTLLVAAIPVSLFVPFADFAKLTLEQWGWITFIGVFSTGFAYLFWHIASKRLNVIPLSLTSVYIGIVTVLSEVLFLKLALDIKLIIGGILMLSASVAAEIVNNKAMEYVKKQKVKVV